MSPTKLLLSVVIPTLNEAGTVGGLLADLSTLAVPHEIIVADGGSRDETVAIARNGGARVLHSPSGRGVQLRAGAEAASASVLCFLHADVRLGIGAAARLSKLAVDPPNFACAFRLRIQARGAQYRLIEAGANLRTRLFGLPYGDQGLVVRRQTYEDAGGYPALPLMEDVALARALRGSGRPRLLAESLDVSSRRWRRDGVVWGTLRNWTLLGRYLAGTSPERLAKHYRPEARRD